MRTLTQLTKKFKSKPAKQSPYQSPADVRIYLRAIFNLAKAGHSPEVVTKAFDDFIEAYKIEQKRKPRLTRSGRRLTNKF